MRPFKQISEFVLPHWSCLSGDREGLQTCLCILAIFDGALPLLKDSWRLSCFHHQIGFFLWYIDMCYATAASSVFFSLQLSYFFVHVTVVKELTEIRLRLLKDKMILRGQQNNTVRRSPEAKQYSRGSCHVFASKLCSLLCYSSLSTHNSTL